MFKNKLESTKYTEIYRIIATTLLIWIFSLFFIPSIAFLCKISMNIYITFISCIIPCIYYFIKIKKFPLSRETKIIITSTLIAIIFGCANISSYLGDYSYDGRAYHQLSIILLKNNWNPIYSTPENILVNLLHVNSSQCLWCECYSKFYEICATQFYFITNNIETGKIIYLLSMLLVFFYSRYLMERVLTQQKEYIKIIISALVAYNPIVMCQFSTYCNDGLAYYYYIVLLFSIYDIATSKNKFNAYIIFALSSVILMNIKLVGIALFICTIIISLIFWKNKIINKNFNITLLIILLSSLLTLINPYITNYQRYKNPFYPLAGQSKIDIMTHNTPLCLANKNPLQRFIISIFNQTDEWIFYPEKNHIKIKFPFTIHKGEVNFISNDTRMGGFGVLFSGIFCLTLLLSCFSFNKFTKNDFVYFVLLSCILSVITNQYAWWARYIPQLAIIPVLVIILSITKKNIYVKSLAFILTLLFLINSTINGVASITRSTEYTKITDYFFKQIIYVKKLNLYGNKDKLTTDWKFYTKKHNKIKKYLYLIEPSMIWKIKSKNIEYEFNTTKETINTVNVPYSLDEIKILREDTLKFYNIIKE